MAVDGLEADGLRDPLTGLATRALLLEHAALACERARPRDEGRVALLWTGIDDFHLVNRSLGQQAGDDALRQAAARLQGLAPAGAVVARAGGDELALLLPDLGADAERVADVFSEQVARALTRIRAPGGHELRLRASTGISVLRDDAQDEHTLLRHAEAAMHEAKRDGGGSRTIYAGGTRESLERLMLTSLLHRALEQGELRLHFQPIVRLQGGEPEAAEALLRWEDPRRGLIPPMDFLPTAEITGLIGPIGEWVLRTACAQARAWRDEGRELAVTVNVSPKQLALPRFVATVREALAASGLPPSALVLELTETAAMAEPGCVDPVLAQLRELGVGLAVDDFGTGWSSFARLGRLPVALVKLDRSLLEGVPHDPAATRLAVAALTLLDALGHEVVAEGVETEEQVAFLHERGCGLAQGFHLGRPAPAGGARG